MTPEERAWNEAHGLTATCQQCGGAMRDDGREVCSWSCWYKARPTCAPERKPSAGDIASAVRKAAQDYLCPLHPGEFCSDGITTAVLRVCRAYNLTSEEPS